MVPDKVELFVMDGADFSQGHHREGQAGTYTVNFRNLKHLTFFCFVLNLIFFFFCGAEKSPDIILFLVPKCNVLGSIFTCKIVTNALR